MKNNGIWFAIGMIWLASAIAIGTTVFVTKNGNYLWFLLVPALISGSSSSSSDDKKETK
jgi:hypothetical protein